MSDRDFSSSCRWLDDELKSSLSPPRSNSILFLPRRARSFSVSGTGRHQAGLDAFSLYPRMGASLVARLSLSEVNRTILFVRR